MNEEDKKIQKHLVDEMMKVSKTNPDVMYYMQALMEKYEQIEKENQKLKERLNCKEYFSSTMPENTEFVILTKNNYDRQQKDLALENIELKQENQKLNKIIEDIDKYIHIFKIEDIGEKTMLILNDILLIKNGLGKDVVRLNKLTELKNEVE